MDLTGISVDATDSKKHFETCSSTVLNQVSHHVSYIMSPVPQGEATSVMEMHYGLNDIDQDNATCNHMHQYQLHY